MPRRRTLIILGVVLGTSGALLLACNGILGIEDVRLRSDTGVGDERREEDASEDGEPIVDGGVDAVPSLEVALGASHTCARDLQKRVRCWGDDSHGQTGTGGVTDGGFVVTPQSVSKVTDAVRIATGKGHTCIVHSSGSVSCWGDNQDGQIGIGSTGTQEVTPKRVMNVSDAKAVACGGSFSCALRAGGSVVCWGNGLAGQLGNGTRQLKAVPTAVHELDRVVALSAGESHVCAARDDGQLLCWGSGTYGQLGGSTLDDALTPITVATVTGIADVAAAARSTCARKATGVVLCWGDNSYGQLGNGTVSGTPNSMPTAVNGLDASALWAGAYHACAVAKGGGVACWGAALLGQIGDGHVLDAGSDGGFVLSPTKVVSLSGATAIGTGGNHSCATTQDSILCWGDNERAQLGTGEAGAPSFSPLPVVGYP